MSALGKTDGKTVSRRDFLSVSLAATGGMLLGFPLKGAFADAPPA